MDSYHSRYPLEYYEIGTPYMFYVAKKPCEKQDNPDSREYEISTLASNGVAATPEQIKEFGNVLKATAGQKSEGYYFAGRYVGVVIGKEFLGVKKQPVIVVMFLADINGKPAYITEKYIVASSGVYCDDREQFAAGGTIPMSKNFGGHSGKTGGFTVANGNGNSTGGFTVVNGKGNSTGGFTTVNGNDNTTGGFTTA